MVARFVPVCALVAAALVAAGCGGGSSAPVVSEATTVPPAGQQAPAFTYDPAQAPAGSTLRVETVRGEDGTTATLTARGLLPNRGYAAHLHDRPCGQTGDAAGPHFQNEVDPAATPDSPSVDPAYANPQNEFWLDLRTDPTGSGTATVTVPFSLDDRAPQSMIVHEEMTTATAPGEAGTAGGRLACLVIST